MSYRNPQSAPQAPQQEQPKQMKAFGGGLTKDPILRETQNGNPVINLDVAMTTTQGTQYVNVTYFGTDAQIASILVKGSQISGTANFFTETFTRQDGTTGTSLKADGLTLLLSAKDVLTLIREEIDYALNGEKESQQANNAPNLVEEGEEPVLNITDDSLPF